MKFKAKFDISYNNIFADSMFLKTWPQIAFRFALGRFSEVFVELSLDPFTPLEKTPEAFLS